MSKYSEIFRDYINWAIGITLLVSSLLLSKETLIELFHSDITHFIFTTTLLIVTIFWFFLYVYEGRKELDLLEDNIQADELDEIMGKPFPVIISLSILYGIMIAYSSNIIIFSAVALLYSLFDLWRVHL